MSNGTTESRRRNSVRCPLFPRKSTPAFKDAGHALPYTIFQGPRSFVVADRLAWYRRSRTAPPGFMIQGMTRGDPSKHLP